MQTSDPIYRTSDAQGNVVDLWQYFGGQTLSVGASSSRTQAAPGSGAVCLYASVNMYLKFGDSTVTAASNSFDVYLIAGAYFVHPVVAGAEYIAAIQSSSSGSLIVMGMR